jgi:hypothetical protein
MFLLTSAFHAAAVANRILAQCSEKALTRQQAQLQRSCSFKS